MKKLNYSPPEPGTKAWEKALLKALKEAEAQGSNWKITLYPACSEPAEGYGYSLTNQLNNAKQLLLGLFGEPEVELKEAA